MLDSDFNVWDECPGVSECELVREYMKLVDTMIKDIQHLEAETVRARYALSEKLAPEHKWITGCRDCKLAALGGSILSVKFSRYSECMEPGLLTHDPALEGESVLLVKPGSVLIINQH